MSINVHTKLSKLKKEQHFKRIAIAKNFGVYIHDSRILLKAESNLLFVTFKLVRELNNL